MRATVVVLPRKRARSRTVWSPSIIATIVALDATGEKQTAIAAAVKVSQAHVSRVLSQHRGAP